MLTTVMYHAGCWDGFCAAWLMHQMYPDANFIPVQYGQTPPPVRGHDLYILDFSFPRQYLVEYAKYNRLTLLDHHKTAREQLSGLAEEMAMRGVIVKVKFDDTKSGARLTYEHFKHQLGPGFERSPWLVDFTEDRDLWLWRIPGSKVLNAGLRSHPLEFDLWDEFHADNRWIHRLKEDGAAILRMEQQIVNRHVRNAQEVDWWRWLGLP